MKQITKIYLIGIFVLICLLLFAWVMIRLIAKNSECVNDPEGYLMKQKGINYTNDLNYTRFNGKEIYKLDERGYENGRENK